MKIRSTAAVGVIASVVMFVAGCTESAKTSTTSPTTPTSSDTTAITKASGGNDSAINQWALTYTVARQARPSAPAK